MVSGIATRRLIGVVSIPLLLGAAVTVLPARAAPGDPLGPAFLVGPTSGTARPAVARSASGEFVVAWHNPGSSANGLTAQRFHADGSADGGAIAVAPPSAAAILDLSVAIDSANDFVVAWTAFDNLSTAWARRFPAGGAAGEAFQLDGASTATRNSASPSVAMAGDGSFVVTWLRGGDASLNYTLPISCLNGITLDLSDPAIVFRRYDATGAAQGQAPGITMAEPGIGLQAYLCAVQINATVASLGPGGGSTLSAPVAAVGPAGGFSIAWAVTDSVGVNLDAILGTIEETHVSEQAYGPAGWPWGLPQTVGLSLGYGYSLVPDQAPRVARGVDGATLIWDASSTGATTNSTQTAVRLRSFDIAGLPLQLAADTVASGTRVFPWGDYEADVAAIPGGSVVAWRSSSLSGATVSQQINVQRLDAAGTALGAPIVPASSSTLTLTPPTVVSDGNGNFAVFWTTLNSDLSQVLTYGQLYSGS